MPECASQFLRFPARETGGDHGDSQQLFLEQRYTQSSFENRDQRRMWVGNRFLSHPPLQIGIGHLPYNGAGTNKGNLDDQIIKSLWVVSWQTGHLGSRFDLKS